MAHTWVEAFMQGKWLNSANNIVVKHPHLAGEMVFPVFTFRLWKEEPQSHHHQLFLWKVSSQEL